ncbi:glycoside hydrolase family 3 N-terminal domain-containing protein [Tsukamurella ocularis]|uniref:glycoside hydrolase family 3 N-terminal domain-containing protein n=1 Tax=Tsukamurella ocularis TaxID=1970234 RepID=UPI002168B189|nr:glycoside hydrolase family 3 N-terminal domain-containing protein [Tsukamurella ocularis]MCS3781416.1 beta-N-acetylhexosaminidase [Tsukamurella ocularis]MCS3787788.1 beta-N-acetylhexosaminidase [Tsukamurella ocularis]MCS3851082.1 beta-N-acetylhexosaminidase [Tsukamurella ocularis]
MLKLRNLTIMVVAAAGVAACGPSTPDAAPSATTAAQAPSTVASAAPSSGPGRPVTCGSDFLSALSVREKVGQLLMVGVRDAADARRAVQQGVGGVFIGSWTDKAVFSGGTLQAVAKAGKVPVMVSVDEEGGRVSRVPGANLVSARELAKTMTVPQARAEGARIGKLLRSKGITVDFAPDADVSAQPDDSVIGDRSYSADPAVVVQYSQAFAAGLRDGGVYPVFKHFPGHGSSSGDSHQGGVSVPPLSQLKQKDLVPFRAAANTGDAGVMVGHLTVPGLTEPGLPTSLSPATMRLLRDGVGYGAKRFDGPIFTDDLSGMKAITDRFSVPQAVAKSLEAGADVALWISTDQLSAAIDAVEASVTARRITAKQLDDSVLRVARAKHAVRC